MFNLKDLKIMLVQNNFSVSRNDFQPNMEVSVNGYIFKVTEMLPTEAGKGKQYRGILTFPDGTQKLFIDKPVFVTKLNEYAGAKVNKVTIPCGHADNSTCHGEHKTTVVSSNKRAKQHRKLMLAIQDIKSVLPNSSDDIVNLIHSRWCEYSEAEKRKEAEAEARKAEIIAKKQAEDERRKEAEAKKMRASMIEMYAKSKGLSLETAEADLVARGVI